MASPFCSDSINKYSDKIYSNTTVLKAALMKAVNGVDDQRYHRLVSHSDRFGIIGHYYCCDS
jgi:hypothetical protein